MDEAKGSSVSFSELGDFRTDLRDDPYTFMTKSNYRKKIGREIMTMAVSEPRERDLQKTGKSESQLQKDTHCQQS